MVPRCYALQAFAPQGDPANLHHNEPPDFMTQCRGPELSAGKYSSRHVPVRHSIGQALRAVAVNCKIHLKHYGACLLYQIYTRLAPRGGPRLPRPGPTLWTFRTARPPAAVLR